MHHREQGEGDREQEKAAARLAALAPQVGGRQHDE